MNIHLLWKYGTFLFSNLLLHIIYIESFNKHVQQSVYLSLIFYLHDYRILYQHFLNNILSITWNRALTVSVLCEIVYVDAQF